MTELPGRAPRYYPAFLDLGGRRCVVVGGGKVAERKALSLLAAGADVRVISPKLTRRLERERSRGRIRHTARRFRQGDLKGAFLVIAATDSEEENRNIAAQRDLLLNVVDRPELCSFIVPASLRRGPLTIAVSTSGTSPAMAREIRKDLEATYGSQFGVYLNRLGRLRLKASRTMKGRARQRYLKSLASKKTVALLKKGVLPAPPGEKK